MPIPVRNREALHENTWIERAPHLKLVPRPVRFSSPGCTSLSQQNYDRLAAKFLSRFRGAGAYASRHVWLALERARADLAAGGEVSERQALRLKESLSRDLTQIAASMVQSPSAAERLRLAAIASDGALSSLIRLLDLSGDALYRLGSESERTAVRHAGEVTCAGMLLCASCNRERRNSQTIVVEQCPTCGGRRFTKIF